MEDMNRPKEEIQQQQPGGKPVNDVINADEMGRKVENQFQRTTEEELDGRDDQPTNVNNGAGKSEHDNMPDSERVTEKD